MITKTSTTATAAIGAMIWITFIVSFEEGRNVVEEELVVIISVVASG